VPGNRSHGFAADPVRRRKLSLQGACAVSLDKFIPPLSRKADLLLTEDGGGRRVDTRFDLWVRDCQQGSEFGARV